MLLMYLMEGKDFHELAKRFFFKKFLFRQFFSADSLLQLDVKS